MFKRIWPIVFFLLIIGVAVGVGYLQNNVQVVIQAIYDGTYDGRSFVYWLLYLPPLAAFIIPIGFVIMVILALLYRKNRTLRTMTGIMFLITLLWCSVSFMLISTPTSTGTPTHHASAQIGSISYHVGVLKDPFDDLYVLYTCDRWGFVCHVGYQERSTSPNPANMQLSIGTQPPLVILQIDGMIVYTARIGS